MAMLCRGHMLNDILARHFHRVTKHTVRSSCQLLPSGLSKGVARHYSRVCLHRWLVNTHESKQSRRAVAIASWTLLQSSRQPCRICRSAVSSSQSSGSTCNFLLSPTNFHPRLQQHGPFVDLCSPSTISLGVLRSPHIRDIFWEIFFKCFDSFSL